MRKTKIAKVLIPLMLSAGGLTACGGGSNDPDPQDIPVVPPTTSADVSGSAVKGALSNANLALSAANSTIDVTTPTSADDGSFPAMVLTSKQGFGIDDMLQISVSSSETSMMVCDAVACGDAVTGDLLTADDISGLTLTSVKWVSAIYGTNSDGIMETTFQANMLTTLAHRLLNIAIEEEGVRVSSKDLLTSAQINASDRLFKILGLKTKGENIFAMDLASAESSANFDGLSELATQLSFINAAFSSYSDGSTLAETITNAATWMEIAFREDDLDAAVALRQFVLDALAGHSVASELEINTASILDITLPLVAQSLNTRPIIEFTTPEYLADAIITSRKDIHEGESVAMAFDGIAFNGDDSGAFPGTTKWIDDGGVPSEEDPSWAQVQFNQPIAVNTVAITSANWDQRHRDVENFRVLASHDGVTWFTLGEFEGITFAGQLDVQQVSFDNDLAFGYYRLEITKNFSNVGLTSISEIEFFGLPVADINHSLNPDKTITSRKDIHEGEAAPMAFDGIVFDGDDSGDFPGTTKWIDNGGAPSVENPSWVQVDYDTAVAVNSIAITSANWDQRHRDVENFQLLASNDGVIWSTLLDVEGNTFDSHFDRNVFTVPNKLAFKNYRLNITKNFSNDGLTSIAEIELIGPAEADMNHSLEPAKTVTSRANINDAESAIMAFDGVVFNGDDSGDFLGTTKWLDNGGVPSVDNPSWVQVDFDEPRAVDMLGLYSANWTERHRDIENFKLLASNDGYIWSTLIDVEGNTFDRDLDRKQFPVANGLAFKHYRLNISKNFSNDGLTSVSEIELAGPATPLVNHGLTEGAIITARAAISEAENELKAFDGIVFDGDDSGAFLGTTKWLDNGGVPSVEDPAWIQIQLPEPVVLNLIAIYSANWTERHRDVENFNLQGSNDGSEWITLTEVEGNTFDRDLDRKQFPFVNGRAFTHYRLNITKNFSNDGLTSMSEIELIGPAN